LDAFPEKSFLNELVRVYHGGAASTTEMGRLREVAFVDGSRIMNEYPVENGV